MKEIPQEIIHKIMKDLLEKLYFPFEWGRETLFYFYYFQKGEEEKLIKSFKYYKAFKNQISQKEDELNKLVKKLKEIKDLREKILLKARIPEEINDVSLIIDDIRKLINKLEIILPEDIVPPEKESLSYENFLWETLSFYLKMTKFITFAINFEKIPKLSERFKGEKIYEYNIPYKIESEKNFLQNLILAICGIPVFEEIEFSLLNSISSKEDKIPESLEIKEDVFIFHK